MLPDLLRRRTLLALVTAVLAAGALAGCAAPDEPAADGAHALVPVAHVDTDRGRFTMRLYEEQAPETVRNFRELAGNGFYDGVPFHRVIQRFVIQTGDPTGTGQLGSERNVPAEPHDDLFFSAGAVGMARNEDPDSASSQWFVCEYPQPHLHDPPPESTYGRFTVWAQVVEGMEVVRAIAATPTVARTVPAAPPGVLPDRPVEEVRVRGITFAWIDVPPDVDRRYPLRTSERVVTDSFRTTLETWRTVHAGEETVLTWYAAPRGEQDPPSGATVSARGPDGEALRLPTTRHPEDPFVLVARATFPSAGAWELTLSRGGEEIGRGDVRVL